MRWVRSLSQLYNFIGYMVLRAPDRFPVEDFLEPEEQMNLERGFEVLRASLVFVPVASHCPMFHSVLAKILDEALAAYRVGDRKAGAHRLQDFEKLIFEQSRPTRGAGS